jgi:hypothetical protein
MRKLFIAALVLVSIPSAALGDIGPPPLPVPTGGVVIVSPPTGDLIGYRIVVAPSGDATAVDGAGRAQRALPPSVVSALFADVSAAMPLSKLPALACAPTPKAPTPLLVSYRGETTPDVTCANDPKTAALFADAQAVARALYVANYRSRSITLHAGGSQPASPSGPAAGPAIPSMPAPAPMPVPVPGGYGGY